MPPHRINSVVFNFDYPDEQTAFRARQKLLDHFDERVLPVLEKALNDMEQDVGMTVIDRLEIDIGEIDIDRLDPAWWRTAVVRAVSESSRVYTEPVPAGGLDESDLESTLKSFLRSGSWRWQSSFTRVSDLEEAAMNLPEERAGLLVSSLYPFLLETDVRLRLAYQFRAEFIQWLVRNLQPMIGEQIIDSAHRWIGHLSTPKRKTFVLRIAVDLAPDTLREDIDAEIRQEARRLFGSANLDFATGIGDPKDDAMPDLADDREPGEPGEAFEHDDEPSSQASVFYTKAAGIVILHPFLVRYFESNRLLVDSDFRSDRERAKGVHLLHFLATGAASPEEHETHLYKVLCGYPMTAPLIRDMTIGEAERAESGDLLRAVVEHWSKLKQTSPEGLREGFLQREGKITRDGAGWRLTVEQRHVDVLLEYLPWQISVIRFPWMREPLWVDWK